MQATGRRGDPDADNSKKRCASDAPRPECELEEETGYRADRLEWVPLSSLSELIAQGRFCNSGSLVALLRLLNAERLGHCPADAGGQVTDAAPLAG
jgi:hypothetical protein